MKKTINLIDAINFIDCLDDINYTPQIKKNPLYNVAKKETSAILHKDSFLFVFKY